MTHWNPFHDLQLERPEEKPLRCKYAVEFSTWADTLCRRVLDYPDVISLNQLKLRVSDRYFDYLAVVPKAHRECVGARGHYCIFHVYVETFQRLRAAELGINPPLLFLPPEPPPPPPIQVVEIPGISLGEFSREG